MEKSDFVSGVRHVLPAVPPNVPFGMLFGATAVEVGIDPIQATAMSLLVFAGAAQMAAVDLLRAEAALPVVLATVLFLNLRYMIYGASLAPEVETQSTKWRGIMGYGLSDINYALAISKFREGPDDVDSDEGVHKGWFYLGVTIPFVLSFVVATAIGAIAGMSVGDQFNLEFAIPLIFIALLVPALKDHVSIVVAVVTAVVATAAVGLPFNSGLLVAVAVGIGAGVAVKWTRNEPSRGGVDD